ncbi:MAG: hypothetical protein R3335_02945 [Anaerolineales bacterium]|nr:hypothetical protein [Anaerolineales bacterium]
MQADAKRLSLVKPTLATPFHIDFEWWSQSDRDWKIYLRGYLSEEDQEKLSEADEDQLFDLVDPATAEVTRVDGMQHLLITKYANRAEFISETTSLVESIFRLLLTNGNSPLNAEEMAEKLSRPPMTILRTLSGPRVYKGVRPLIG